MTAQRTLGVDAVDKKTGMTLDELAEFVQDAQQAGATGTELVEVTTVGFTRPRIKTAKVTITGGANTK